MKKVAACLALFFCCGALLIDLLSEPLIDLTQVASVTDANSGLAPTTLLMPVIAALIISMVVIPLMVRLAPVLGMMDKPDPRKVHAVPVPRVGGTGIFLGAIIPIVLLVPLNPAMQSFLLGSLVLFVFGVLDDCRELGHYVKFIGQFIAVLLIVYYGDVYVTYLPFMGGEPIVESIGRPFTVIAMVGMINAINHSDGLDGLAGGESLLSLAAIAWFAYEANDSVATIIALSTIGGLFGFMRFNTHPARIFMGDGGSQFLGLTLGFLAVLLTQEVNPALSPALPALILGLPVADIVAVFVQRIYHGMNWFQATRNHIHHRLLDLGFFHYESVVIVYSVHALLVIAALLAPYESDVVITGFYFAVIGCVFTVLFVAEKKGIRAHDEGEVALLDTAVNSVTHGSRLPRLSFFVVQAGISLFLVTGAVFVTRVPVDFMLASIVLGALLLARLLLGFRIAWLPLRPLVYTTIAFIVYLSNTFQPLFLAGADPITYMYFGILIVAMWFTIRISNGSAFAVNPMDFLVVLAVMVLAALSSQGVIDAGITAIALKSIILFYGAEIVLGRMESRWNLFTGSVLAALVIVSFRGLLLNIV